MTETSGEKRSREEWRRKILQLRAQVTPSQWRSLGQSGTQRVLDSEYGRKLFGQLHVKIGMYSPLSDEPSLEDLEALAVQDSRVHLFYPRILSVAEKKMTLVEMPAEALIHHWVQGPYGIREPHPSLKAADDAVLKEIDLIFVPGVVLGEQGERWGRGAGYYDRFLPQLPQAIRVAFAFEFQITQALQQEPWDQGVDWILTEKRELKGPRFLEKWKLILK